MDYGIGAYAPAVGFGLLLIVFVLICFQEAINGFHDTATAITSVIYSNSLKPQVAVLMSAVCNFLGVVTAGTSVAFAVVYLLPTSLIAGISTLPDIAFLLAMTVAAISWNFGTWWYGIPNSTTHAYIGSIMGTTLAFAVANGLSLANTVNWHDGETVLLALLLSPLLGFLVAYGLHRLIKATIRDDRMYLDPSHGTPPPAGIRWTLIASGAGVSFLHGSNDGQKSIGLLMLVTVGMAPALFGLDRSLSGDDYQRTLRTLQDTQPIVERLVDAPGMSTVVEPIHPRLDTVIGHLTTYPSVEAIPGAEAHAVRDDMVRLHADLGRMIGRADLLNAVSEAETETLRAGYDRIRDMIEHVPFWIVLLSATLLGLGTAIGYKRIVETLGEKMGDVKMNAAHGTSAQLTAMLCIGVANVSGAPVSTTHVLSSGVVGSMAASGSKIQGGTVRSILIAWVTTLPATMAISFFTAILLHLAIGS